MSLIITQKSELALDHLKENRSLFNEEQLASIFLVAAGQNNQAIVKYIMDVVRNDRLHQEGLLRAAASGNMQIIDVILNAYDLRDFAAQSWREVLQKALYLAAIRGQVAVVQLFQKSFDFLNVATIIECLKAFLEVSTISSGLRKSYQKVITMLEAVVTQEMPPLVNVTLPAHSSISFGSAGGDLQVLLPGDRSL